MLQFPKLRQKKYATFTIVIVISLVAVISHMYKNTLQKSLSKASTTYSNSLAFYKPHTQAPSLTRPSHSLSQTAEDYVQNASINWKLGAFSTDSSMPRIPPSQLLMGDYQCQDSICSEILSKEEKTMYTRCTRKASELNITPAKCHFINSTGRAAVALSSFPGSGNTWVRGLLEKATDVCTGAIYCDVTLRRQGFAGEHVTTGAVLVVKTHGMMTAQIKKHYGAAIHLVRNPFGSMVAEYNREKSIHSPSSDRHIGSVGIARFGNSSGWRQFVQRKAERWQSHFTSWTQNELDIPVLHVLYEDIKKDRVREVKRMLEFLGVPYSEEELRERLSEDFDLFHRSKHGDFDPYTPEQREYVNQQIREAVDTVRTNNNGDSLELDILSYLESALQHS